MAAAAALVFIFQAAGLLLERVALAVVATATLAQQALGFLVSLIRAAAAVVVGKTATAASAAPAS